MLINLDSTNLNSNMIVHLADNYQTFEESNHDPSPHNLSLKNVVKRKISI